MGTNFKKEYSIWIERGKPRCFMMETDPKDEQWWITRINGHPITPVSWAKIDGDFYSEIGQFGEIWDRFDCLTIEEIYEKEFICLL